MSDTTITAAELEAYGVVIPEAGKRGRNAEALPAMPNQNVILVRCTKGEKSKNSEHHGKFDVLFPVGKQTGMKNIAEWAENNGYALFDIPRVEAFFAKKIVPIETPKPKAKK